MKSRLLPQSTTLSVPLVASITQSAAALACGSLVPHGAPVAGGNVVVSAVTQVYVPSVTRSDRPTNVSPLRTAWTTVTSCELVITARCVYRELFGGWSGRHGACALSQLMFAVTSRYFVPLTTTMLYVEGHVAGSAVVSGGASRSAPSLTLIESRRPSSVPIAASSSSSPRTGGSRPNSRLQPDSSNASASSRF